MKGLFLILLVFALSANNIDASTLISRTDDVLPNGCPIKDGVNGVYFPDLTDCESYYKCYEGELVLQTCPGNLVWNNKVQYCDEPKNVNCMDNAVEQLVNEIPNHCAEKPTGYTYSDPDDCQNFVTCLYGKPVIQRCGEGTLFNSKFKVCDWPQNVDCCENGGEAVDEDHLAKNL